MGDLGIMQGQVADSLERILGVSGDDAGLRASRSGGCHGPVWESVLAAGLNFALIPEDRGGFGLPVAEAVGLLRVSGRHGGPVPLAETALANRLLALAGLDVAPGLATVGVAEDGRADLAWALPGGVAAVIAGGRLLRVDLTADLLTPHTSLSGLPRADLAIPDAPSAEAPISAEQLTLAGAALRTQEIAGALDTVVAMTIAHVTTREQFGKPLARNQAVQHGLAIMASESAAAGAAAALAADAFERLDPLPIAAAKARASEAAGIVAGLAHQLHGAIGFTKEYRLQLFTRALWQWRDDFGSEHHWHERLGAAALGAGRDGYWPLVTGIAA